MKNVCIYYEHACAHAYHCETLSMPLYVSLYVVSTFHNFIIDWILHIKLSGYVEFGFSTLGHWPNTQGAHHNLQRLHFDIMCLLIHAFWTKVACWYVVFFYKNRSFSFTLIGECSRLSWAYLYESGWPLLNNMYVCHLHGPSSL